VKQSLNATVDRFLRLAWVVLSVFAVTSAACTHYTVAERDGGTEHVESGGAAGSVTAGTGGAAGTTTTGKGGAAGFAGLGGAGGIATTIDGSVHDTSVDSAMDKAGVDAASDAGTSCISNAFKYCPSTNLCVPNAGCCIDADCVPTQPNTTGKCNAGVCSFPCASDAKVCGSTCIPATSCCGGTCVTAPSAIWTIGALVGASTACPAGYSSTATTIHTGVSVGCASGCGCTAPVTGSCLMNFSMAFPLTTGNFTVFGEMQCTAASGNETDVTSQISANQPAAFLACSNTTSCPCDGRSCPNCDPTGATAPLPVWQTSMSFCPLAAGSATCPAGQCAPTAAKICVMSAGTQPCPAGFTAMGASGSWATGATAAGAACICGGCGVASGESCASTSMTVGYGVCHPDPVNPGASLAGQFKGDGTSPPANNPAGWLAAELFPALTGTPTPGVCDAPNAIPSGGYTPTGPQTVCCL